MPPIDENTVIPVQLSIKNINLVLATLSEQPLKTVLDVFTTLKAQADAAVLASQVQALVPPRQFGEAPPPDPPSPETPPPLGPAS